MMGRTTVLILIVVALLTLGIVIKEPTLEPTPPEEVVATMLAPCFAAVPEEHREAVRGLHLLSDGHGLLVEAARLYPDHTRRLVSDPTFRELCDEHGIGDLLRYVENAERLIDLLRDERPLSTAQQ